MKKVLLSLVILSAAQASFAANKSAMTEFVESTSSSSYSKVECSMEDFSCAKLIVDMGRQEALSRALTGDQGPRSVVLQKSIAIVRQQDASAQVMTDAQIEAILATQAK